MPRTSERVRQAMEAEDWQTVDGRGGYGTHEGIRVGDTWMTPGGEVAVVTGFTFADTPEATEVTVEFPDRDALNEQGETVAYEYTTSAASLMARMAADGGWDEVQPVLYTTEGVNCPVCGSFMSLMPTEAYHGGDAFATAQCREGHLKHHDALVEDGEALEVLL